MLQYITEIESSNDRAIILSSLIGSINGALVGQLSQAIRNIEMRAGDGGIDGYNDVKSGEDEDEANEAPVGMEERVDPMEVAAGLKGVKQWLLTQAESLLFMDQPIEGNIADTLDFMLKREPQISETALAQLAEVLSLPTAEVKAAHLQQVAEDRTRLAAARDRIIELEADLPYDEGEHAFHELPARFQARICQKAELAIQKRVQRHIQQALRGNLDATGDLVQLRDVQSRVKNWVHRAAHDDQSFAEALVA